VALLLFDLIFVSTFLCGLIKFCLDFGINRNSCGILFSSVDPIAQSLSCPQWSGGVSYPASYSPHQRIPNRHISATQTHTAISSASEITTLWRYRSPIIIIIIVLFSFLLQSACGTFYQLMSSSCHQTASKLNWTQSSWCKCHGYLTTFVHSDWIYVSKHQQLMSWFETV